MKEQLLVTMIAMAIMTSIAFYMTIPVIEKKYYKQGFEAGIQYEKKMRQQAHDSIVANCKWNNGVPTKIRDGFDKDKTRIQLFGE
jgi:hypothetical protein